MLDILSKKIAFLVCEKTDLLPLEIIVKIKKYFKYFSWVV